jgi:hypothetical protein
MAAPAAAPAAAPVGPVGLPPGFGHGGAPKIGNVVNRATGGIPPEHFNKPILFRIISVDEQVGQYGPEPVTVPTVDYIVLDPDTGESTVVSNIKIWTSGIRSEIIAAHTRGLEGLTGVAIEIPSKKADHAPAKVLRALDDTNSRYGAELATQHLLDAARNKFGWWPAA